MLPRQCQGQGSRYTIPPVVGQSRTGRSGMAKSAHPESARAPRARPIRNTRSRTPRSDGPTRTRAPAAPALLFRPLIRGMIPGEHNGTGRGSMGRAIPGVAGASNPTPLHMLPTLHKRRSSIMASYRNGRGNLLNGSHQGLSLCSFGKSGSCDQKWQCLAEINRHAA